MNSKYSQQDGFVSIVISVIVMVILSLVTIGFAQIMGREQRQALDRQLSTQAFYAAESGVNDARVSPGSYSANCSGQETLDPASTVRVTCVYINNKPNEVTYNGVDQNVKVFPLHLTDNAGNPLAPQSIKVKWTRTAHTGANSEFRPNPASTLLPTYAAWGTDTGLLRVALVLFKNGDSRESLIKNQAIALLNPTTSGASANPILANLQDVGQYKIINGVCTAGNGCTVTINTSAMSLGANYDEAYFVVSSLYKPSDVEISAITGASSLYFNDVQAVINSTGKTNDVLRRIEVRAPLITQQETTASALTTFGSAPTDGICKQWKASPVSSTSGC